tara:strand:- start:1212 stop:1907 length:696 start_codon:yes stop_codon:yes gene_type:complete
MPQLISKKKIYFYLFILLLVSSTFNFNIISKFKKLNLVNNINIVGLDNKEMAILEKNLEIFKKKNIFLINKEEVNKRLNKNSFLDDYTIIKILPSKLLIKVKKTDFVGSTIFEGEKYYIGKNGKLTNTTLVEKQFNLPQVFGNFQVNELLKLNKILNLNGFNLNKIKKYYYFKSDRWDIKYNDNTVIMLPSYNLEKSLKNYISFVKKKKIIPGQIIDLRIKNKIILSNVER